MKRIQGVQLMEGSNEEMLPGFTPEFPYIASCVDLYPNITAPIPWHWHRAVELFYMNRGTQEYTTPHGTWVFPEGSGGIPLRYRRMSGDMSLSCGQCSVISGWNFLKLPVR